MRNVRMAMVISSLVLATFAGASRASATTIALSIPQSLAFSYLGRSCGGIQEQQFATGFDASSGYPTGAIYLQTRCGGSGRGGGYHVTTYSAWVAATWDFTGTVIASNATAAPAGLDPTFTAFDAFGNEVYDTLGAVNVQPSACSVGNTTYCTYRAYLALASDFVPAPRVTTISVANGPASGGTSVAIAGTGFTGATGVAFGGVAASFTVNSDTSITAVAPAAAAGAVDVTVTNAGGSSATNAADVFTFVAAPTITSIAPNSGSILGGDTVTLTGTNLSTTTSVTFGDIAAGFVVDDDGQLTVTTPGSEAADTVTVRVTTVGGTSPTTASARYTYVPVSLPVVTGVTPNDGTTAGGDIVTITGSGFIGVFDVAFGGIPASFTISDDATIVAVTPSAVAAGVVDVVVTSAAGPSAAGAADRFTYSDPVVSCVGSACPSSVQCGKVSGFATGVLTLSKCTPTSLANRRGGLDLAAGVVTWRTSAETTVVGVAVTSPGQGSCRAGHLEYDVAGTVTGGTSTYTASGDGVVAQLCVNAHGKVALVKDTAFGL